MYKQNKDLFIFSLYFFLRSDFLLFRIQRIQPHTERNTMPGFLTLFLSPPRSSPFPPPPPSAFFTVCIILNLYATFIYVSLVAFMYKVIIFRVR